MKTRILEHCHGESQRVVRDHSLGRCLLGECNVCHKIVRLTAQHTPKAHGTWLYYGPNGYQTKAQQREDAAYQPVSQAEIDALLASARER